MDKEISFISSLDTQIYIRRGTCNEAYEQSCFFSHDEFHSFPPEIIGTISHDSLGYKGNVIPLFCLTD